MTDEHYRAINRAIALVSYSNQDEREAARTALHHIFGRENRLREFSKAKGEIIVGYQRSVLKIQDENARLREALEKIERGKKPAVGWQPVVPEVSLTQKEMQDIARNALAELKGGTP